MTCDPTTLTFHPWPLALPPPAPLVIPLSLLFPVPVPCHFWLELHRMYLPPAASFPTPGHHLPLPHVLDVTLEGFIPIVPILWFLEVTITQIQGERPLPTVGSYLSAPSPPGLTLLDPSTTYLLPWDWTQCPSLGPACPPQPLLPNHNRVPGLSLPNASSPTSH